MKLMVRVGYIFCLIVIGWPNECLAQDAESGVTVYSHSPIDPVNPSNLSSTFKAGDYIYAVMSATKPWNELYAKRVKQGKDIMLMIQIHIDGQYLKGNYVTLKNSTLAEGKHIVLDIAPDPKKMTAYRNPDYLFASHSGASWGPQEFTKVLSELTPGKHTVKFEIYDFGNVYSQGTFEIEGNDFSYYSRLHEQITLELDAGRTMPAAGMTDKKLEGQMRKLAEDRGWKNIQRIVIKDKDWWHNRSSGGNSPIISRYLNAAIASRDANGSYYYKIVIFTQPKTISGGWGSLEYTSDGQKILIAKENISK